MRGCAATDVSHAGRIGILCICSAVLLALTACERGRQSEPAAPLPPMRVQVSVNKPGIKIGDLIRYTLDVDAQTGVWFRMPEFAQNLGGFAIRDWDRSQPELGKDGRIRQSQTYDLETYLTGTYEIPPAHVTYILGGETNIISSTPICVEVTTVAEDGDLFSGIRDIKGPVAVTEVEKDTVKYWLAGIVGLAAMLVAIVLLVRHFRGREKAAAPPVPAHVIAYAALRALAERKLVEHGMIKEYYYELSNVLRHYIENRFGLRAPERTTEEFLMELRTSKAFSNEYRGLLKKFLRESDMVKFANYGATPEDARRAHDVAVNFIEETKEGELKIENCKL